MFSRHSGFFHSDLDAKMWYSVLLVLVQSRKVQLLSIFNCEFAPKKKKKVIHNTASLVGAQKKISWYQLCFHTAPFSSCFCLKFYLPFLRTRCVKYPQINLRLSADIMLICNMLARSCAARRSQLPAVCLHFTLFNVGSPVCEAQLHGLNVNQSIPCERECSNKCRLVIFLPKLPQGGWGTCKRSSRRTYASHQSRWQMEEPRRRSEVREGGGHLPSSNSPSLESDCLGCILAFSVRQSSSRYSASGLPQTLPVCAFLW